MMSSQSDSEKSSVGARFVRPAELTRMSTFPSAFTLESRSFSSEPRSDTSEVTRNERRPPRTRGRWPGRCRRSRRSRPLPSPSNPRERRTQLVSPVPHRAVEFAVHRQIRSLVRKLCSQLFVVLHTMSRFFPGMQITVFKEVGMRKDFVSLLRVAHVFLNSEIADRNIEMQRRPHCHR